MFAIFKKKKLINMLCKAFPTNLHKEVESICRRLVFIKPEEILYTESFHWGRKKIDQYEIGRRWSLSCGEDIIIPYRVYFSEAMMPPRGIVPLSETEKITAMRDKLINELLAKIPYTKLNGPRENRLPGNVNISF